MWRVYHVPMPVAERFSTPGPWYSTIAPVPPLTVRIPATLRMMSLGAVQPDIAPVSFTPITLGALSSQGRLAMTSTASAPPTPIAAIPRPPALGVWESVPIRRPPGKAVHLLAGGTKLFLFCSVRDKGATYHSSRGESGE